MAKHHKHGHGSTLTPGTLLNMHHTEKMFEHQQPTIIDHIHKDRKGKFY